MSAINIDDQLRAAAVSRITKKEDLEGLSGLSEDALYDKLFSRTAKTVVDEDSNFRSLGDDDLMRGRINAGKGIFQRWSKTLQAFVCSPAGEADDLRKSVIEAIAGRGGSAAAVIAGALVSSFGLAPAIAAVVAALVLKLVVAPAGAHVCGIWEDYNNKATD